MTVKADMKRDVAPFEMAVLSVCAPQGVDLGLLLMKNGMTQKNKLPQLKNVSNCKPTVQFGYGFGTTNYTLVGEVKPASQLQISWSSKP